VVVTVCNVAVPGERTRMGSAAAPGPGRFVGTDRGSGRSDWRTSLYACAMPKASPDNPRPIGSVHRKRVVKRHQPGGSPRLWNVVAIALGVFLTVAGVMHFANPSFFDAIVPPWLWPSERFWTYASGVAEIIVGPLVIFRRTRRVGALAAVVLLIAVYPANLYMVWDWRDRSVSEQFVSWIRLPFQFVFIWLAWSVAKNQSNPA
jgi:uncharacterized membrane protein